MNGSHLQIARSYMQKINCLDKGRGRKYSAMEKDTRENRNFQTRRDSSTESANRTRRDGYPLETLNVAANEIQQDNLLNLNNREESYPSTTLDKKYSNENSRPLPPVLNHLYCKVEALPTQGAEADLYVVEERVSGNRYVLKHYREGIIPSEEVTQAIQNLSEEHNDYFIQVINYSYSQQLSYEVLEYLEEGSLANLLAQNERLNKQQISDVLTQLSTSIDILHKNGIVHRDLKPGNVLIRQHSPLKLALIDFGISSALNDFSVVVTSTSRTLAYAPPEAMSGKVSLAFDFWSLGIILVELLTGRQPFEGLSDFSINSYLIEKSVDLSNITDQRWNNLCRGLLLRDSQHRWGKAEIDRWITGEALTVHTDSYQTNIKPYILNGKQCYSKSELAIGTG